MNPECFVVGLTPSPTAARVSRQRSSLRLQIIFAAIFGAVLLMIWLGPQLLPGGVGQAMQNMLPAWGLPAIAASWALATLVRIGVTVFFLSRAKRDLMSLDQGTAFYIDPAGMEFVRPRQVRARWAEITALKISGPSWGAGPRLRLEVAGQEVVSIPASFLAVSPGDIDSAVRARSMGRIGLDASDLDRML